MSGERVYSIEDGGAVPLETVSLAEAGLKERQDLQERVLARPTYRIPDPITDGADLRLRSTDLTGRAAV